MVKLRSLYIFLVLTVIVLLLTVTYRFGRFQEMNFAGDGESMVLSLDYWEQAANAMKNLFDLQCWANSVNISKVVMPAIESGYRLFHLKTKERELMFDDLFDLDHWNGMSQRLGYSALVPHSEFLQHASRDVVYVQILYHGFTSSCMTLKSLTKKLWSYHQYLRDNHFTIIKTVCIDFKTPPNHAMTEKKFSQKIFGGVYRNVTVVFDRWEGIRLNNRVALSTTKCINLESLAKLSAASESKLFKYAPSNSTQQVVPSKHMSRLIDQFLFQYIPERRYIAVMLRTEKLFSAHYKVMSRPPDNNPCTKDILSDWRRMLTTANLTKTILVADIGGHGSIYWNHPKALNFTRYLQNILKPEPTQNKINSALERISQSNNSVEIAILQQQLVARATCALIVGGGSFQDQTFNVYAHIHKGSECYTVRKEKCQINSQHV